MLYSYGRSVKWFIVKYFGKQKFTDWQHSRNILSSDYKVLRPKQKEAAVLVLWRNHCFK